jgi:DNA-binding response OmpR family regulator
MKPGKATILIIEDEKDLAKLLKYNLEKEGQEVLTASDGAAGLSEFEKERPDLVILDLMLPKMDGLQVCRAIRKDSSTPIIMLTAKREETDRIVGLEMGADDYVTKPFSIRELVARVKAILRRTSPVAQKGEETRHLGELRIDFERHEVKVAGQEMTLSPREFQFLKLLVEVEGRVLSRNQLVETVWKPQAEIDARTVDQHIARLRRKLGAEGDRIITVKNIGYRIRWD